MRCARLQSDVRAYGPAGPAQEAPLGLVRPAQPRQQLQHSTQGAAAAARRECDVSPVAARGLGRERGCDGFRAPETAGGPAPANS